MTMMNRAKHCVALCHSRVKLKSSHLCLYYPVPYGTLPKKGIFRFFPFDDLDLVHDG
jgi:hypothetical protein